MQFKDRLITDHAAAWAAAQVLSADSMTVISQSEESTVVRASALQSSSESSVLTQDDIKNLYQSHKKE